MTMKGCRIRPPDAISCMGSDLPSLSTARKQDGDKDMPSQITQPTGTRQTLTPLLYFKYNTMRPTSVSKKIHNHQSPV